MPNSLINVEKTKDKARLTLPNNYYKTKGNKNTKYCSVGLRIDSEINRIKLKAQKETFTSTGNCLSTRMLEPFTGRISLFNK